MAKFCKHCGNPLKPGQKFCSKCGASTGVSTNEVPNAWTCPTCGHEGNTKKFCGKCGTQRPEDGKAAPTSGSLAAQPQTSPPPESTPPSVQSQPYREAPMSDTMRPEPAASSAQPSAFSVGAQEAGSGVTPKRAAISKKGILLVALVVLAVAAYFGSGKLMEYLYERKCGECVAVLTESKSIFEEIGSFTEDVKPEVAAQKGSVLAQKAEQLEKLCGDMEGAKLPKSMEAKRVELVKAMKANAEMLSGAAAVLQVKEVTYNRDLMTKFTELWKGFSDKWGEANKAAEGVAVKEQSLRDAFPYADAKKAMQTYRRSKSLADTKYMKEQYDQHKQKRKDRQKELMGKKEVVFLANDVRKDGSDLVLRGKFYNGTDNIVTSVKNMLVDVKLFLFDAETESLTDVPYEANITGLSLAPGQSTDHVELRLQGKAPAKDFNYFEDHVHKITWGQRRVAG